MAFRKPAESNRKRNRNIVRADRLVKVAVKVEEEAVKDWNRKWSWLLDELAEIDKKADEITKNSIFLGRINKEFGPGKDTRSIKPIPETINHTYGRIANMPEFKLEKYGPDYFQPPLPTIYQLVKKF